MANQTGDPIGDSATIFTMTAKQNGSNLTIASDYTITPKSDKNIEVTIKETHTPTGYVGIGGDIVLTFKYNQSGKKWDIAGINNYWSNAGNGVYTHNHDRIEITNTGNSTTVSTFVVDVFNYPIPKVKITPVKKDKSTGGDLGGAQFTVKSTKGTVSPSGGVIDGGSTATITLTSLASFTVTVEETTVPQYFYGMQGTIELEFKYVYADCAWQMSVVNMPEYARISSTNSTNIACQITLTINNKPKPDITIDLTKLNTIGQVLNGGKFNIVAKQSGSTLLNTTVIAGQNVQTVITPKNLDDVSVEIQEIEAPTGHLLTSGIIKLKFHYRDDQSEPKYTWEFRIVNNPNPELISIEQGTNTKTNCQIIIKVKNKPKADLDFYKVDILTNDPVKGVRFNVKIQNIGGLTNPVTNTPENFNIDTDGNGMISFRNMEFVVNPRGNGYEDIIITLEEKVAPVDGGGDATYRLLHGPITITIRYNSAASSLPSELIIVSVDYDNKDHVTWSQDSNNYLITLQAGNIPIIHLGGIVWIDKPYGTKLENDPDGYYNNEQNNNDEVGYPGVGIYLYKEVVNNEGVKTLQRVTQDVYGTDFMTETAETNARITYIGNTGTRVTHIFKAGEYLFPNLAKLPDGLKYYVYYRYDGMNYETTQIPSELTGVPNVATEDILESVPSNMRPEKIRNIFNSRYSTITSETTVNDYFDINSKGEILTLDIGAGLNGGLVEVKTLDYETYKKSQNGKRYVSKLKTTRDYDSSTHQNGKDVLGKYRMFARTQSGYSSKNTNINCGLKKREFDLSLMNDLEYATVSINGKTTKYIYDAITGELIPSEINEDIGAIFGENVSAYEENGNKKDNYQLRLYKSDVESDLQELDVYVTYKIILNNQSKENGRVNSIVDYFDTNYAFEGATYEENGTEIEIPNSEIRTNRQVQVSVDGETRYFNKISINHPFDLDKVPDMQILRLTFKVMKRPIQEGDIFPRISTKDNCENIAEIDSYTIEKGIVDEDSKPGNTITQQGLLNELRLEDDSDMSIGVDIFIDDQTIRKIEGKVWEDEKLPADSNGYKHGNGIIDQGENAIKELQVDLYEVINDGRILEWRSSQKTNEDGEYSFMNFIPGDYVVKFNYGYENNETNRKYNGQDYKCAINGKDYDKVWENSLVSEVLFYNDRGYAANESVAADSARRRLKVMSYSAYIDSVNGEALASLYSNTPDNEVFENTKMYAYTHKINVTVDTVNFGSTSGDQIVDAVGTIPKNEFNHINFGLERRPKTKIVLEKHITALKLTANNRQTIIDASANIDAILANGDINELIQGIRTGLQAIKATRSNNGSWTAAIDIDELIHGARLEVEYTYVIKNEGEIDYIGTNLSDAFTHNLDNYAWNLGRTSDMGTLTTNLVGSTYYTGIVNSSMVAKVGTVVKSMVDYVNNQLFFEDGNEQELKQNNELSGKEYNFYANNVAYTHPEIVNTVLENPTRTRTLLPGDMQKYKVRLYYDGLSVESDLEFEAFIAQIMSYYNAAGRKDEEAVPGNLKYVYSYNSSITLDDDGNGNKMNEHDEFWAEKVVITKPTGGDRTKEIILAISILVGTAMIATGAYVIKKKLL